MVGNHSTSADLVSTFMTFICTFFVLTIADAGQTYFLGKHPVHVNFFKPCYKPQWHPSNGPSDTEHLVISKDLVEEDALQEMRLEVESTENGAYILDCQLTAVSLASSRFFLNAD
jgi:hypothetical protein